MISYWGVDHGDEVSKAFGGFKAGFDPALRGAKGSRLGQKARKLSDAWNAPRSASPNRLQPRRQPPIGF